MGSKQTSFRFTQKVGGIIIRLKGFVTREGFFTVGTITGAKSIFFPFEAIGHEFSEIEMRQWADDNGYDLDETDANTGEVISKELETPTVLAVAVNGADKMDLSWIDNNGGAAKTHVERLIKVAEANTLSAASGANVNQGDYFIVRNQARKEFVAWIDIDGDGTEPTSVDFARIKKAGGAIAVGVAAGDTADQVAVKIDAAIAGNIDDVTVTYAAGNTMTIVQDISGFCQDLTLAAEDGAVIDGASLSNVKDVDGADEEVFTEITIVDAGTDVFQDTALDGGKEHFYRVRHIIADDNTKGDSAYSDVDSDFTP